MSNPEPIDIVQRLRHERSMNPEQDEYKHEVLGRAASEIEALRERAEQAERDRDEARKEVVRVRGALNQIAWPASQGLRLETIESLQHIARDTLAILWAPSAIAALTRCTPASREGATIDDGTGSRWTKCSPKCSLRVVRPGKVQCNRDCAECPSKEPT